MSATPIVSSFTSQPQARPLLAWSSSQMRQIQKMLQTLIADWHAAWAIHAGPAEVHVDTLVSPSVPENATAVTWQLAIEQTKDAEAAALHALQATLFGGMTPDRVAPGGGPVIAQDVARAAWTDWLRRLESMFGRPVILNIDDPVESEGAHTAVSLQIWSGALCARVVWCGLASKFLMAGTVVQRLLQSPDITKTDNASSKISPALVNLGDALETHALEVRAELSPVTLTLGELETLSVGDIVVIPHQLTMPLQVIGPRDDVLCEAWLGKQSGRVALELVRHTATSNTAIPSV